MLLHGANNRPCNCGQLYIVCDECIALHAVIQTVYCAWPLHMDTTPHGLVSPEDLQLHVCTDKSMSQYTLHGSELHFKCVFTAWSFVDILKLTHACTLCSY